MRRSFSGVGRGRTLWCTGPGAQLRSTPSPRPWTLSTCPARRMNPRASTEPPLDHGSQEDGARCRPHPCERQGRSSSKRREVPDLYPIAFGCKWPHAQERFKPAALGLMRSRSCPTQDILPGSLQALAARHNGHASRDAGLLTVAAGPRIRPLRHRQQSRSRRKRSAWPSDAPFGATTPPHSPASHSGGHFG